MITCGSCGAEFLGSEGEFTCRGCNLIVCASCSDVFEHIGDGAHETGDPAEAVRALRSGISFTEDEIFQIARTGCIYNADVCRLIAGMFNVPEHQIDIKIRVVDIQATAPADLHTITLNFKVNE